MNSSRPWTGDYITDFRQILPGKTGNNFAWELINDFVFAYSKDAAGFIPLQAFLNQDQEADVSLVSGQMRHVALVGLDDEPNESCGQVSHKDSNQSLLPVGSDFLKQRGWSGLEPHVGETPVRMAHSGRRGFAAGYIGEGQNETKEEHVDDKVG